MDSWAVYKGLCFAWDLDIRCLVIETDSQATIDLLQRANSRHHPDGSLIEDCRSLLAKQWQWKLQHTPRDGNQCADFLSKEGHKAHSNFVPFHAPPHGLCNLILADLVGVSTPRI